MITFLLEERNLLFSKLVEEIYEKLEQRKKLLWLQFAVLYFLFDKEQCIIFPDWTLMCWKKTQIHAFGAGRFTFYFPFDTPLFLQ